jgi:hypothetical protein
LVLREGVAFSRAVLFSEPTLLSLKNNRCLMHHCFATTANQYCAYHDISWWTTDREKGWVFFFFLLFFFFSFVFALWESERRFTRPESLLD